jgi:Gpi18-like mannosyltransferase
VPLAIAIRLVVVGIGYLAVATIGFRGEPPANSTLNAWWDLPQRWDAGWYVGIAHDGYDWTGDVADQQNLNFFPAYPMLVRAIAFLVHTHGIPRAVVFAWTATLVSIAAFAAAAVYIYRIAADRFGDEVAKGAVLLIATYPFALFYGAVYSEALYLLCAAGAWYHFEKRQLAPAAIWGVIAGLCRPNGCLLVAPLLVGALAQRRKESWVYLAAITPVIGTLVYSAWAYSFTGHPFVWAELQRTAWLRTYEGFDRTLWQPITAIATLGLPRYVELWPWTIINLAPTLLALAAIWPVWRRLGAAAGAFVAINTVVPLVNGGLVGMGRYTSVLFPMFIWLALATRRGALPALSACFATAQGLAAALFFTWRQIF